MSESIASAVAYWQSKACSARLRVLVSGRVPRRCTIDRAPRAEPERRRSRLSAEVAAEVRRAHALGRSVDALRKEFRTSARLIRLALKL